MIPFVDLKAQHKFLEKKLKKAKIIMTVVMLVLGVMTLFAYAKIGYEHQANYGERYTHSVEVNHAN